MSLGLTATAADAAEYVLGGGFAADDAGGSSLSVLGDVALGESTWLTLTLGATDGETLIEDLRTRSGDLELSHEFGTFGLRLRAGVWGDEDRLETTDAEFGVYWRGDAWRIGVDLERRDVDLTFFVQPLDPALAPRRVETGLDGDGIGLSVRYRTEANTSFYVNGTDYDYSVDVNRLAVLDRVRRISPTTLTLAGALRDFQWVAGAEWEAGESLVGIEFARDRLSVGRQDVTSLTGTLVVPAGARMDVEFSLGYSRLDNGGDSGSAYGGVFLFFYGG